MSMPSALAVLGLTTSSVSHGSCKPELPISRPNVNFRLPALPGRLSAADDN
jgi:hypothetical protein